MNHIQKNFNKESIESIIQYLEIEERSLLEKIKNSNEKEKNSIQIELRKIQGKISRGLELLEKNS